MLNLIHQPDPEINWRLPPHLQKYYVSGSIPTLTEDKSRKILKSVRANTLLNQGKLLSLYSHVEQLYYYLSWLPQMLKQAIAKKKAQERY